MKKVVFVIIAVCVIAGIFIITNNKEQAVDNNASTRIVKDSTGKEVTIPLKPKRVVLLSASHLDLFVAAGGQDKIVGKPNSQALSDEVRSLTSNVKEIGQSPSPNAEIIMSLNPDLVIGVNMQPHSALVPMLEKAGVSVYLYNINNYEDVLEHIKLYGELAGTQEVASKKIEDIKLEYDNAIKKSSGKKAPKSLVLWGTPDSFSMATNKSFIGDLIERLGGNNILDNTEQDSVNNSNSSFLPFSMEYVTKADPEVIFLITHGSPEELKEKFSREMDESPLWQGIDGVKNQRIYTLPYQLFAINPGSRIGQSMNLLADYMYGEI